jgi:rhodanese-related sulfurtransferase
MIRIIDLDQVQKMKEKGAQIVEVLASKEYADEHIPGAISIPLLHMNASSVAVLDKNRPIIVYCWDYQ